MKKFNFTTKSKKSLFFNSIKNNVFKSSIFVIFMMIITFAILVIVFSIKNGVEGGNNTFKDWKYFMFGSTFSAPNLIAGGFMVVNTIWTTFLAMIIAIPISVATAVFITRISHKYFRGALTSVVFVLSAVPTVIYGNFGMTILNPFIQSNFGGGYGTILSISLTLAMMTFPTITMMSIVSINNVNKKIEDSSYALGATKQQSSIKITLRSAAPGITVGIILAVGRSIGEATAVSMISAQPNSGPSFGLMEQIRLLTATMLNGWGEATLDQRMVSYSLAMLLVLMMIVVFGVLKFASTKFNLNSKIKKQEKKLAKKKKRDLLLTEKKKEELNRISTQNDRFTNYSSFIRASVKTSSTHKKTNSRAINLSTLFFSLFGILFLVGIITFLYYYGSSSTNWDWLTSTSTTGFGKDGTLSGLAIPFWNTLLLAFSTLILLIPFGVLPGIYLSRRNSNDGKMNYFLTTIIDFVSGIPSLIFGIIGFLIFVPIFKNTKVGQFSGIFTLTFIAMPTVIRSTENAINQLPKSYRLGSYSLGGTFSRTSLKISLPAAFPSIASGMIFGVGRVLAESASLIILFGSTSWSNIGDAMQFGGQTLATKIWEISKLESPDFGMMAAIGINLLKVIFVFIIFSNFLKAKEYKLSLALLVVFGLNLTSMGIKNLPLYLATTVLFFVSPLVYLGYRKIPKPKIDYFVNYVKFNNPIKMLKK